LPTGVRADGLWPKVQNLTMSEARRLARGGEGDGVPDERARSSLRPSRGRIALLCVTAVALYAIWPRIVSLFSQVPRLTELSVPWFVLGCFLEAVALVCSWGLFRLAIGGMSWFLSATTQLASNAFSRLVPGGAAAGGSASYQMLASAGLPGVRIFTAMTATSLLTNAVVLALPLFSLPVILGGAMVHRALVTAAEIGGGVFLLILGVLALFLSTDAPLEAIGRTVQSLRNRVARHRPPVIDLAATIVAERNVIRQVMGRSWWEGLLFATGRWLFDFGVLLAALGAVGARPRPALALLAYVVAALLGMLPFTPGGLGFVEIGLAATLQWAVVSPADAVLATLAYRAVSFWLPIPAGIAAYVLFRRRYGPLPGARQKRRRSKS
jgi:uncharacterized protein (TIRG00374 family)